MNLPTQTEILVTLSMIALGLVIFSVVLFLTRHRSAQTANAYVRSKLARLPKPGTQAPLVTFYEVDFIIDNKIKKFKIDGKTFEQIPEKVKGQLTFQGARLIRFEGEDFCVTARQG